MKLLEEFMEKYPKVFVEKIPIESLQKFALDYLKKSSDELLEKFLEKFQRRPWTNFWLFPGGNPENETPRLDFGWKLGEIFLGIPEKISCWRTGDIHRFNSGEIFRWIFGEILGKKTWRNFQRYSLENSPLKN